MHSPDTLFRLGFEPQINQIFFIFIIHASNYRTIKTNRSSCMRPFRTRLYPLWLVTTQVFRFSAKAKGTCGTRWLVPGGI